MADRDFVVKNGLRTVGNTIVANSSQIQLNSNIVIDSAASLTANGSTGSAGQYLISNGTGVYWATVAAGVNTAAAYSWTNTHTYSANVTFNSNVYITNTVIANGGSGTAGQVLTSNGSTGSPYWSTLVGVNTAAAYTFTNTIIFTNTFTTNGRLVLDNIVTANGSNGSPGQVLTTNSLGVYWSTPTTGTVTSVGSGFGLGGGPINTTGTLFVVANTGIVSNSSGVFVSNTYVNTSADFVVNGSLTFSNVSTFNSNVVIGKAISVNSSYGTAGQALISGGGTTNNYWSSVVSSVAVTANQLSASFSGANPTLGLVTLSNVVAGAYTLTTITVDSFGRIAGIANGSAGAAGVTSVANGTSMTVSGTGSGPYTGAVTVTHATSGVSSGSYTAHGFTVDAQGHITATAAFRSASTSQQGMVQLTDSYTSTSTTTAATPAAVKVAYDTATGKYGSGSSPSFGTVDCSLLRSSGDVIAYFSDARLKTNIKLIPDALNKINQLSGVTYNSNEIAAKYGYDTEREHVGVLAQEVQKVLPQVIASAPFDIDENGNSKSGENYMTVQYDKIVPLLIESIKELSAKVETLNREIEQLKNSK